MYQMLSFNCVFNCPRHRFTPKQVKWVRCTPFCGAQYIAFRVARRPLVSPPECNTRNLDSIIPETRASWCYNTICELSNINNIDENASSTIGIPILT